MAEKGVKLTADQQAAIKKGLAQGKSPAVIADEVGVCYQTVSNYRRRWRIAEYGNIPTGQTVEALKKQDAAEAAEAEAELAAAQAEHEIEQAAEIEEERLMPVEPAEDDDAVETGDWLTLDAEEPTDDEHTAPELDLDEARAAAGTTDIPSLTGAYYHTGVDDGAAAERRRLCCWLDNEIERTVRSIMINYGKSALGAIFCPSDDDAIVLGCLVSLREYVDAESVPDADDVIRNILGGRSDDNA